jgi:hypothetical protein
MEIGGRAGPAARKIHRSVLAEDAIIISDHRVKNGLPALSSPTTTVFSNCGLEN